MFDENEEYAFPVSKLPKVYQPYLTPGLTKREYFAAAALMGYLVDGIKWTQEDLAWSSVSMADALIKELSKDPK